MSVRQTPPQSPLRVFSRNLAAYCASEVAAKASRLLVVVAVARTMDVAAIGVAAAAMAAADILKSLTENGVGQRIISASDDALEATCRTAHRIFWVWCLGLVLVQLSVALTFAALGNLSLALLIAVLAGEYLFMPAGLVQAALAVRAGKLRQTAAIAGGQVVIANVMSAVLAILWPSALALILPRLLTAPLWLVAMRRLQPWHADRGVQPAPLRGFVSFGAAVLGVEIAKALRLQLDKVLIGVLMGAEVLGLYFMAFNAGLSIATSFSVAFSNVLFAHLCAAQDRAAALRHGILVSLGLVGPVIIAQSLLAPLYVPILFGAGWEDIDEVVSILCLSALPAMVWTAAAGWLRAQDRPQVEFVVTLGLTAALAVNIVLLAPYGLVTLAWGYLIVASVVMLAAALPALKFAFSPSILRV